MALKVKDFMEAFCNSDDMSVVVLEHGQELDDVSPNGSLHEAENRYGWWAANFPQYAEAELDNASYQRYDSYHSTLVIRLKAPVAA